MNIERSGGEIIFRMSGDMDILSLQKIMNFLKYKEAIKQSQGTEKDAAGLSAELKSNWWKENKARFLK